MSYELLGVCAASALGSAFSVWGVVRHELSAMRERMDRAESRLGTLEDLVQRLVVRS